MSDSLTPFVTYAKALAPPFLQGIYGSAWHETFGLLWDVIVDAHRKATLGRFIVYAPSDALPYSASERQLEQMPGEAESVWRERLRTAWDAWVWAGTAKGVIDNVKLTGLTNVSIYTAADWPDASPDSWARFWVVIGQPNPWTAPIHYGDTTSSGGRPVPHRYGEGLVYGVGGATENDMQRLRRQVRLWKPAHAQCVNIVIQITGHTYGDGSHYGDSGLVYGGVTAYLES